jgi:molecular chaperone GrpE
MSGDETAEEKSTDVGVATSEPETAHALEDSNGEVSETEALRRERDDYYDRWLRKEAEFQNYRKRASRENETLREVAYIAVLRELLTVIDSFEQALERLSIEDATASIESYRKGFELLLKEQKMILSRFKVVEVPALGETFDPQVHEAVQQEISDDHPDGKILEIFRKGYTIKGRLLRAAQVKVATCEN